MGEGRQVRDIFIAHRDAFLAQLAALAMEYVARQAVASFAAIELTQDNQTPVFIIDVVQGVQRFLDATELGQRQGQLRRPVPPCNVFMMPVAGTRPSLRKPARRNKSSRFALILPRETLCRSSELSSP